MRAKERFLTSDSLRELIDQLRDAVERFDRAGARDVLSVCGRSQLQCFAVGSSTFQIDDVDVLKSTPPSDKRH